VFVADVFIPPCQQTVTSGKTTSGPPELNCSVRGHPAYVHLSIQPRRTPISRAGTEINSGPSPTRPLPDHAPKKVDLAFRCGLGCKHDELAGHSHPPPTKKPGKLSTSIK